MLILCPIYYEKKEKEAAIEKCQENYISILNMLNVYSGTNEMYEENNFSIRREILCLDENALDVEMINQETGEANVGFMHSVKEDEAEQLGGLVRIYEQVKDNYLEKVSKVYDKYLEVNGEKYAGKEKYQLNYEDCLALEEYFEEEPDDLLEFTLEKTGTDEVLLTVIESEYPGLEKGDTVLFEKFAG